MAVQNYRQHVAWQRAMDLAAASYRVTSGLPPSEQFGLTFQVRKAAVSVPSNIAEGHGRGTPKAMSNFVRIANGSTNELETQLMLAERLGFLSGTDVAPVLDLAGEVGRLLTGLRRSLERQ
ncbi:MAG TPA: four helix bundle protein [Planctomycetaceae bacterium]